MFESNPYSSPQNSYQAAAVHAAVNERTQFIQRTYLHLVGAIFAFVGMEAVLFTVIPNQTMLQITQTMTGGFSWLIVLGAFMVASMVANKWAHSDTSETLQYAGLLFGVVAYAVLFVPLLCIAINYGGANVLPTAGIITMIIFGGLTAMVFVTKADFSWLGRYLSLACFLALGLIVAGMIFQFSLGLFFTGFMIAVLSGYILYDTSNILHHYRTDQHVAASLALFASVATLLWYVIQLVMQMQDD